MNVCLYSSGVSSSIDILGFISRENFKTLFMKRKAWDMTRKHVSSASSHNAPIRFGFIHPTFCGTANQS